MVNNAPYKFFILLTCAYLSLWNVLI
uniref:Uncharacterized protein n=1 Tax=Rhizophora mucronata TaxID=61149 RepID=A0A2P2P9Z5_RHIMU